MAIRLTDAERSYVAQGAATEAGFRSALLSCLSYLAPVVLFGVYGVAIADITAIALAFACLVALNLWWIAQQCRSAALFKSICAKIEAETGGQEAARPGAASPDAPRPAASGDAAGP